MLLDYLRVCNVEMKGEKGEKAGSGGIIVKVKVKSLLWQPPHQDLHKLLLLVPLSL
jgi:hypothetical protein